METETPKAFPPRDRAEPIVKDRSGIKRSWWVLPVQCPWAGIRKGNHQGYHQHGL